MIELIKRNCTGKKTLLFFILANIFYILMLTITIPNVMRYSGGMKLPDMQPAGYTPDYINTLLNTLGDEGRNAYLYFQIPLDMIYPFLFGISYSLVLAYFLTKIGKAESIWMFLCLLPLFAGFFDYAENAGIIILLNSYPGQSVWLSRITNIFSILKSAFTTTYFIVLIIVLILFGINRLQRNRAETKPENRLNL